MPSGGQRKYMAGHWLGSVLCVSTFLQYCGTAGLVAGRTSRARFTKYLTIYHKIILTFIVKSPFDSDLQRAKISV